MFRKQASLPKKNNITRTHEHRAHPRTKGKARRGGVGGRDWRFACGQKGQEGRRGRRGGKVSKSLDGLTHLEVSTHALSPLVPLRPLGPLCFSRRSFSKERFGQKKRQMTRKSSVNFQTQRRGRDWLLRSLHSLRLTPFPSARRRGPCKPYTQQEATS